MKKIQGITLLSVLILGVLVVGLLLKHENQMENITKQEYSKVERIKELQIGLIKSEKEDVYKEEQKFVYKKLLATLSEYFNININYRYFNTREELEDGLKAHEVSFAVSKEALVGEKIQKKTLNESSLYALYSWRDFYGRVPSIADIPLNKIGYIENNFYEDLSSYFFYFKYIPHKYTSYEEMLENMDEDEMILLPFQGEVIPHKNGEELHLVMKLKDFFIHHDVYVHDEDEEVFTIMQKWQKQMVANGMIEELLFQSQLENGRKRLKEQKLLHDVEDKEITIVYSDKDEPLVVQRDREYYGIIPAIFEAVGYITESSINYMEIHQYKRLKKDKKNVFFTDNAYGAINQTGAVTTRELFKNSLVIVGESSSVDSVTVSSLAMKRVGILNKPLVELALKAQFPKMNTSIYETTESALKAFEENRIDYLIIDEYTFHYITVNDQASHLFVSGNYNYNHVEVLYSHNEDKRVLDNINLALQQFDRDYVVDTALLDIVARQNNQIVLILLLILITILLFILLLSGIRSIQYRNEKEKLDHLASHDSLSNCLNLVGLVQFIQKKQSRQGFYLAVVDINHFKKVNDIMSYSYGSKILIKFTRYMETYIGEKGIVARNGNDDFIIALYDIKELYETSIEEYVEKMYIDLTKFLNKQVELNLSICVGVSYIGAEAKVEDVYTEAENAVFELKANEGVGIQYFDVKLSHAISREQNLSAQLGKAFSNKEFILHFQPQYEMGKSRPIGVEALVRWEHPKLGLLTPYYFLHIMRKENVIKQLDSYVLEMTLEYLQKWEKENIGIKKISVNISSLTFFDKDFLDRLEKLVDRFEVKPKTLCIEITEDFQLIDTKELPIIMEGIQKLGIEISIDDFGTGYSSLNYLVKYPIDYVKIDKGLVDNIVTSTIDFNLLSGIIDVLQGLNKKIVVEGIEVEEQLDMLQGFHNLIIQGYYYSKPVSEDDLIGLLGKGRWL